MQSQNDLDLVLIKKFVENADRDALEELILRYEKSVYLQALRLSGNREDAAEITQESFLKLYRSISTFRGQSSFKTWLYSLVTNTAYDFLRKRKPVESLSRYSYTSEEEKELDLPDLDPIILPEELLERSELKELVKEAIWQLSPQHREVLFLFDYEQMSYKEIVHLLDTQLGTGKSRFFRARQALKEEILKNREHFSGYLRQSKQGGKS